MGTVEDFYPVTDRPNNGKPSIRPEIPLDLNAIPRRYEVCGATPTAGLSLCDKPKTEVTDEVAPKTKSLCPFLKKTLPANGIH